MSLIYTMARPAAKTLAKRQLEEGLKDPDAYRKKVKELQAKPLPLDRLHKQYAFEQEYADGTVYYRIRSHTADGKHVILYFHGGGYCRPLKTGDFEFGEEMADETGADVWLVNYALFPDATGMEITASAVSAYRKALLEYEAENISFYGNSAGGALCFAACIYLRKYLPGVPLPGSIVSHSPSIRIPAAAKEQEKMNLLDPLDIILPAGFVNLYTERTDIFQSGGFEEFASPIDADWHGFPPTLAVFGTDEVFLAYLPGMIEKCRKDGVELETYVGKGCHCYCAKGILPEAHEGRERIYAYLRGVRRPEEKLSSDLKEELRRNQKKELDAVVMYRMLADRMGPGKEAEALRRLAADERRHAKAFEKITGKKEKPDRLQADAICLMYQTLGKERLFRLMAKGENDAACRYVPLGILFPQIERIRQEEQKHAQALLSLL